MGAFLFLYMLKYRIERFFRTKNNLEKFKQVVYMIEERKSLAEYREAPKDFIRYLENHGVIQGNVGYFRFTDLGLKYFHYYMKITT